MKKVAYLIHVPLIVIGFLVGTITMGIRVGYEFAYDFWGEV